MAETGKVDFAIEIDHNFPPDLIVGHYQPQLPNIEYDSPVLRTCAIIRKNHALHLWWRA